MKNRLPEEEEEEGEAEGKEKQNIWQSSQR